MYSIDYKVTISDINYGGHMGNERALLLFQQVRIELFQSLNVSEIDTGDGVGVIQKDAHVYYKGESFIGDLLKVKIVDIEMKKISLNFKYEVLNQNGVKVLEGSTQLIAYNYNFKKIGRFSEVFLNRLKEVLN